MKTNNYKRISLAAMPSLRGMALLLVAFCLWLEPSQAQNLYNSGDTLYIGAGATLYMNSSMQNAVNGVKNPAFYNNGTLNIKGDITNASGTVTSGTGWLNLSGTGAQNFSGANYYSIRVTGTGNKIMTSSTILKDSAVLTNGSILMADADTIYLDTLGGIQEPSGNEILGNIKYSRYLKNNTAYSFCNMGLDFIAHGATPGKTNIIRSTGDSAIQHGMDHAGATQGTKRYFDIHPTTNLALNANIVFHYFDAELNGIAKSDLSLYRSIDTGRHWIYIGYTSRDSNLNTLSMAGVNSFSRWTTGSINNPLPVELLTFTAKLENAQTAGLDWITASEINNDHFDIERSEDGKVLIKVGEEKGHGTTSFQNVYHYDDAFGIVNVNILYYRLKQVDYNGKYQYSEIRKLNLTGESEKVTAWYNGLDDKTEISLDFDKATQGSIRMIDIQGKLLAEQSIHIQAGQSHMSMDMFGLAKGIYTVSIGYDNGIDVKRIMKY